MASRKSNHFSGLVGPIVVYEWKGKPVMRARPRKYKKTKGTLAAQDRFGNASYMSARIRENLDPLLPNYKLPSLRYRLEDVTRQWLRSAADSANGFSFFDHFQFNEKALMPEKLKLPLSTDWNQPGKIIVQLPAIIPMHHIAAPADTESIEWVFYAFTCNAGKYSVSAESDTMINMRYDDNEIAAQQIELPCKAKKKELKLVVLGLRYIVMKDGKKIIQEEEKWRPVEVVGSSYE